MWHFSSALLERTSEVFKPITTNQDKNQQLLAKSLKQDTLIPGPEVQIKEIKNKPEVKADYNGVPK